MHDIYVATITAIISPTLLFIFNYIRETRKEKRVRLAHHISEINMKLKRMEIIMNICHNSEDKETILKLYDEYKKIGGNSYIQHMISEWKNCHKKTRKKCK